ncbi:MAG: hypothetical protein AB1609_13725, partial [Bacillota bacterium]
GRIEAQEIGDRFHRIWVTAPQGVSGHLVVRCESRPRKVRLERAVTEGGTTCRWAWDDRYGLLRVWYEGSPDAVVIRIEA